MIQSIFLSWYPIDNINFSGSSGDQTYADIHSEDGDNYMILKGYLSKDQDTVNVAPPPAPVVVPTAVSATLAFDLTQVVVGAS